MRKLLSIILTFCCFNSSNAQNVGIGTTTSGFLLNFANTNGDKISLFGNLGKHNGLRCAKRITSNTCFLIK